jgi:hypothetical protein
MALGSPQEAFVSLLKQGPLQMQTNILAKRTDYELLGLKVTAHIQ